MKQYFLAATICCSLLACTNNDTNTEQTKTDTTPLTTIVKDTSSAVRPIVADEFPATFMPEQTFAADKADLHEYVKVQQLSEKKIAYEIYMVNGGCAEFKVQGVATIKEGDAESDMDENNNGFFVDEYADAKTKDCSITIRIGADKGYTNRARFYLDACAATNACKDKLESEPLQAK
jgi:hypothetical protein